MKKLDHLTLAFFTLAALDGLCLGLAGEGLGFGCSLILATLAILSASLGVLSAHTLFPKE